MASKSAIARLSLEAKKSLTDSLTRMADQLGVDVPDLAGISYRRDPAYEQAVRFQAFAEAAKVLADTLEQTSLPAESEPKAKPTRARRKVAK